MFSELVKTYNLDDYAEPTFSVVIQENIYSSRLVNLKSLIEYRAKSTEIESRGIVAGSPEFLAEILVFIFPGSSIEMFQAMNIAFLSALFQGAVEHVKKLLSMSMADLENFKPGKAPAIH